ncbi:VOC family protein [uncultured Flavobacterium sp.]|uniref:bleomycin resistance protein n=1 Tax=uncultured Flavobacterium sp. TaxID=165435 RepID=UPI0030EF479C|tara:strand:+ start:224361 stop:224714 length:354 start_codon:yes stop_codon:yes gene_type:complete
MLTKVIPKLPFIDKQKTIDFYVNQMGFSLLSDYGDYILLSCDTIEIHFFSFPTLIPEKSDFMIYLRIDSDIENYYQKLQKLEVEIYPNGTLETKPWNQKEFAIIDPNGTLLTFGQSV